MCQQTSILKRAAGWLDNSVFLGILWSLSRVSAVLLLAAAVIPWNQVRSDDRLAYQALLFPCVTPLVVCLCHRPAASKHQVQTWALLYWEFHYAKRILETFFVHRYVLHLHCTFGL